MAKVKKYDKVETRVKLDLSESEAWTLRYLLYVTQLGNSCENSRNASELARKFEKAGFSIDFHNDSDLISGKIMDQQSINTGIYWSDGKPRA